MFFIRKAVRENLTAFFKGKILVLCLKDGQEWLEHVKIRQFEEMLKYKELSRNITEIHHYTMNEDEYRELEYFAFGGCFMFTKWVSNGMKESPEFMTELFGRRILPFAKELFMKKGHWKYLLRYGTIKKTKFFVLERKGEAL